MSTMDDYLSLDRLEIVPGRPFTDIGNNAQDLKVLEYIVQRLRYVLSQQEAIRHYPWPFVLYLPEAGKRRLRISVTNPEELETTQDLTIVGFCGQKRSGVDRSQLSAVDIELVSEFLEHPHLLSYNSLEMEGGNWCNLVLFSHPQGITHWATSARHAQAARELAPQYYLSIRLHNGVLPGGLMSGKKIVLTCTKYFDYQNGTIWRAVRELQAT